MRSQNYFNEKFNSEKLDLRNISAIQYIFMMHIIVGKLGTLFYMYGRLSWSIQVTITLGTLFYKYGTLFYMYGRLS